PRHADVGEHDVDRRQPLALAGTLLVVSSVEYPQRLGGVSGRDDSADVFVRSQPLMQQFQAARLVVNSQHGQIAGIILHTHSDPYLALWWPSCPVDIPRRG